MTSGRLLDTAVVLRGGSLRDVNKLSEKVGGALQKGVGAVLSVWCADALPGETRHETLARVSADAKIPHPKIMVTNVGSLRAHNLRLERDVSDGQSQYHYHVHFELPVQDSQIQSFIDSFGLPEPNPTGGR